MGKTKKLTTLESMRSNRISPLDQIFGFENRMFGSESRTVFGKKNRFGQKTEGEFGFGAFKNLKVAMIVKRLPAKYLAYNYRYLALSSIEQLRM